MSNSQRGLSNNLIPRVLIVFALFALVVFGNPAIALLVGMAISLSINRAPISQGST